MIATGALSAQSTTQQQPPKEGAVRSAGFFAVEAGSSRPGKSIPVSGRRILVKVSGTDTGGSFALFEVPAGPNAGPGLHMHHVENEVFYVLEGELDVQVGTEIVRLGPGGSVYAPRLIPHTWQPAGGRTFGSCRWLNQQETSRRSSTTFQASRNVGRSHPLN